mmetsp:Transcript_15998/g.50156  ORF Transcript_15998/g.50156 Transcript_15998/m.50156 type:complete len:208 (-) Transcript_15998:1097-1720(-)
MASAARAQRGSGAASRGGRSSEVVVGFVLDEGLRGDVRVVGRVAVGVVGRVASVERRLVVVEGGGVVEVVVRGVLGGRVVLVVGDVDVDLPELAADVVPGGGVEGGLAVEDELGLAGPDVVVGEVGGASLEGGGAREAAVVELGALGGLDDVGGLSRSEEEGEPVVGAAVFANGEVVLPGPLVVDSAVGGLVGDRDGDRGGEALAAA